MARPYWTAWAVEHELQLKNLEKHAAAHSAARLQEENLKLLARTRELEAALKDAVAEIHTLVQKLAEQSADDANDDLFRTNLY